MSKRTNPSARVSLHDLVDEASASADDLGYALVGAESVGVTIPADLAGRIEESLKRACADLASLMDELDELIPRPENKPRKSSNLEFGWSSSRAPA